jgi:hypothetical protein
VAWGEVFGGMGTSGVFGGMGTSGVFVAALGVFVALGVVVAGVVVRDSGGK